MRAHTRASKSFCRKGDSHLSLQTSAVVCARKTPPPKKRKKKPSSIPGGYLTSFDVPVPLLVFTPCTRYNRDVRGAILPFLHRHGRRLLRQGTLDLAESLAIRVARPPSLWFQGKTKAPAEQDRRVQRVREGEGSDFQGSLFCDPLRLGAGIDAGAVARREGHRRRAGDLATDSGVGLCHCGEVGDNV